MIKKLIIDTGTWMKLDKLLADKIISEYFIKLLYDLFEIIITPEIESEMTFYQVSSWLKNKTYVMPVKNNILKEKVIRDGFDEADASIFGIDHQNCVIMSEDRPLIEYGRIFSLNFLFFAEFLLLLCDFSLLSKTHLYHINKHLFSIRNINKKLYKEIKQKNRT